ncbi:MAG TPA: class I SAM-dependent methyltransferase [Lysobacter sp.]
MSSPEALGWIPDDGSWTPSLRYLLRRNRVMANLPDSLGEELLEVGCGAASLLVDLQAMGYRCTGLESSAQALAVANRSVRQSGHPINLHSCPGNDWQERFGALLAMDVLEHIEHDVDALREWSSWLRSGATVLISVPAHRRRWGSGDDWAGHFRRYDREDITAAIDRAGLQLLRLECYGFPAANLTEIFGEPYYRAALKRRKTLGMGREEGNAASGVERTSYRRVLPLLSSAPGLMGIKAAFAIQNAFLNGDAGSGYFAVARRP